MYIFAFALYVTHDIYEAIRWYLILMPGIFVLTLGVKLLVDR